MAEKDRPHLERFKRDIKTNASISPKIGPFLSFQIQLPASHITERLENLGCVARKSKVLTFPVLPSVAISHFIRGYFDGDGSATIKRYVNRKPQKRMTFLGTRAFLDSVKDFIGDRGSISKAHGCFALEYSGNLLCEKVSDYLYGGATIYLKRKKDILYAVV
jgi:hypothetical protein